MGRTLGVVAHEVGTPLHSVAGHVELLRQELPSELLQGAPERRLGIIQSQLVRITETIQQLLTLTHRPAGDRQPVHLNQVVHGVLELVTPGVAAAQVEIRTELAPELPAVLGDAHELQQALLNVVANALDAMPGGGVLTIGSSAERRNGHRRVAVWVRDTGPGIPAEHIKQIFEPFFTTKQLGKGTGLGLFITRQIVREHGGELEVESDEGKGSVFCLLFSAAEGGS